MHHRPKHLDVKRDSALTIEWEDGSRSTYTIAYLRKCSPSADAKKLREEMQNNPLTILPDGMTDQSLSIENIELIGNYAVRISFSDGHHTGIYSWNYLREIDPAN
ncbi:gamma-butyrobetaine hydroxylase-like domain-containing protein [Poriferisphaera sp. WC338]|uniref:gamma-butyrobetaine hydroxylase-like domain-containing protein n=1 Tax=Poriferisphaera sp. WC338 TaxID=3425129 RepID=UPI003D81A0E7